MRAITREEMGKISGGRQKMPTGGLVPELKKGPPGADSPTWTPAEEVEGITDSFMASDSVGMFDSTVSSHFFTTDNPGDATNDQLNETCSILEKDCTYFEDTGTHISSSLGSIINPDLIDWNEYSGSGDSAYQCVQNVYSSLASGLGICLDPNYNPTYGEFSIDQGFIDTNENVTDTMKADVPNIKGVPIGTSGVTVANGFDLGHENITDLENLGLSNNLIAELTPYLGSRGYPAMTILASNPLTITPIQAAQIDYAKYTQIMGILAQKYDNATSVYAISFTSLPTDTQTAIADVAFQYGPNLAKAAPNFWEDIVTLNWNAAYNELMNFHDGFTTRRQNDAALLKHDIDSGALKAF